MAVVVCKTFFARNMSRLFYRYSVFRFTTYVVVNIKHSQATPASDYPKTINRRVFTRLQCLHKRKKSTSRLCRLPESVLLFFAPLAHVLSVYNTK